MPTAMVNISELRLLSFSLVRILMPPTNTMAKHRNVSPPTTQSGMEAMMLPNFATTPKRMSHPAHAKPAARDAHLVREMMPLFCEKVVFGGDVKIPARMELKPSASRPPCMRESNSAPLDGNSEASQDNPMSP